MKTETLEALKLSIAHWRRLSDGTAKIGEVPNGKWCALCSMFFNHGRCSGCPVANKAGETQCFNTPYGAASFRFQKYGKLSKQFKIAAAKELEFLRSLLPTTPR